MVTFFPVFPPISYMHSSSPHHATCPVHLILLDFIIPPLKATFSAILHSIHKILYPYFGFIITLKDVI
jgi:hypothetical protein